MSLVCGGTRSSKRRKLALVAWLAACVTVFLAGCQTRAYVRLDVAPDGSGRVSIDVYLDAEAVQQIGNVSDVLDVDDLSKAGWEIVGPASPAQVARRLGPGATRGSRAEFPAGTIQVHLQRPFKTVDEANRILASLSGPKGPLRDMRLERSTSTFSSKIRVRGSVDLSHGIDTFSDAALDKSLGSSLGDVVSRSGGTVPEGDDLTVSLQIVPRSGQSWHGEMGNESLGNETVGAQAVLGSRPQHIDVTSTKTRRVKLVIVSLIGMSVAVIGFLAVTAPRRRARRRGRHTRR